MVRVTLDTVHEARVRVRPHEMVATGSTELAGRCGDLADKRRKRRVRGSRDAVRKEHRGKKRDQVARPSESHVGHQVASAAQYSCADAPESKPLSYPAMRRRA